MLCGLLALIAAAVFAGAAWYITLAEHPARLHLPTAPLLIQWKRSYARGFLMQATLSMVGGLFGVMAWWATREWLFLIGSMVLMSNWPFTLLGIMPVNRRLNATDPEQAGDTTRHDLLRWGDRHAFRSVLGTVATVLFVLALLNL